MGVWSVWNGSVGCLEWECGVFGMGVWVRIWVSRMGIWFLDSTEVDHTIIQAAGGSVFGEVGLMAHIEQLWACVRKEVRR